jgi:hypothetical protein
VDDIVSFETFDMPFDKAEDRLRQPPDVLLPDGRALRPDYAHQAKPVFTEVLFLRRVSNRR